VVASARRQPQTMTESLSERNGLLTTRG